jgi:hypothetical protein
LAVQIDKSQILSMLNSQGKSDTAQQADAQLPDTVDTDQHAGLLSKLNINPSMLTGLLGGSGQAGGIAGELGKLL